MRPEGARSRGVAAERKDERVRLGMRRYRSQTNGRGRGVACRTPTVCVAHSKLLHSHSRQASELLCVSLFETSMAALNINIDASKHNNLKLPEIAWEALPAEPKL